MQPRIFMHNLLKSTATLVVLVFTFASTSVYSADADTQAKEAAPFIFNNREIAELFVADRLDRLSRRAGDMTLEQMEIRDRERRAAAFQMHKEGLLRTKDDLESAAMIFHHGETPQDYRLAFALATAAAAKSDNPTEVSWLMAVTFDRWMVNIKRPQWYGSQYLVDEKTLYPIDWSAVDDAERRRLKIYPPKD